MTNDHLQHYASPYYDPVKAHEYYMEHRVLKGRNRSRLSEKGKEVWDYTESQIKGERSKELETAKEEHDSNVEELRTAADETRERISKKLRELNERLSEKDAEEKRRLVERAEKEKEEIAERREREIKALGKKIIPVGANAQWRSRLIADRKEEIADIRNKAKSEITEISKSTAANKTEVSKETRKSKTANSDSASEERKRVATELKGAIAAAREAYKLKRSGISDSYEQIFQQEFDKIAAEFPRSTKKTSGKSSKKATKKTTSKKKTPHKFESYTKDERRRLIEEYRKSK